MFWRVPGYSQPSPLEAILDKDGCTLEEVLDEDDLIQECKALNGRLINFLKRRETVARMLEYLVHAPAEDAGQKAEFKYPFAACEVLCCEVDALLCALLEDDALMALLFSFLEQATPVASVRAGYFARVVTCLLVRRGSELMAFLRTRPATVARLVDHVDTTSISEVLVRLIGADTHTAMHLSPQQLAWLADTPLMEQLLAKLEPGGPGDAARNAAAVLAAVARAPGSPLGNALADPGFLGRLVARAFAPGALPQALDVCIAVLEPKPLPQPPGACAMPDSPTTSAQPDPAEADAHIKALALQATLEHLGRIATALGDLHIGERRVTTFGVLDPPLGSLRLRLVRVVAAIVQLGTEPAEAGIKESGAALTCLRLFLRFPFNNLLHHLVAGMVAAVLDTGSDAMLAHLLGPGRLLEWVSEAPDTVDPAPRCDPDGPGPSKGPRLRAGYMGHITAIGRHIVAAAAQRPDLGAALQASDQWQRWDAKVLAPALERGDVERWECGRPTGREAPRPSSSDAGASFMEGMEAMPSALAAELAAARYPGLCGLGDPDDDDLGSVGNAQGLGASFPDLAPPGFPPLQILKDSSGSGGPDSPPSPPSRVGSTSERHDEDEAVLGLTRLSIVQPSVAPDSPNSSDSGGGSPEPPLDAFDPFRTTSWQAFPELQPRPVADGSPPPQLSPGWAAFDESDAFGPSANFCGPSSAGNALEDDAVRIGAEPEPESEPKQDASLTAPGDRGGDTGANGDSGGLGDGGAGGGVDPCGGEAVPLASAPRPQAPSRPINIPQSGDEDEESSGRGGAEFASFAYWRPGYLAPLGDPDDADEFWSELRGSSSGGGVGDEVAEEEPWPPRRSVQRHGGPEGSPPEHEVVSASAPA